MKLIIVRGPSGSGKTTFARNLSRNLVCDGGYSLVSHKEADDYFVRPDGTYDFNSELLKNAHYQCLKEFLYYIKTGLVTEVFIVSNTFTRLWEMQPYLQRAAEHGIPVEVYRCTGEYQNVHGVPESKVKAMRLRMEDYAGEVFV